MHAAGHMRWPCARIVIFYGKNWHGGKVTFFSHCTSHVRRRGDARAAVDFFGCFLAFFTSNFHIRTHSRAGLALASPGLMHAPNKGNAARKNRCCTIIISGVKRCIYTLEKNRCVWDWIEQIRGEGMCFIMRMLLSPSQAIQYWRHFFTRIKKKCGTPPAPTQVYVWCWIVLLCASKWWNLSGPVPQPSRECCPPRRCECKHLTHRKMHAERKVAQDFVEGPKCHSPEIDNDFFVCLFCATRS